ncbi:hypothetical protein [Flavisolibacter nicotianae]|uniref:hypothetical protein n=1 Tax=Flavisolibacter nicotianae TaxID=2364882 RepID=UPI000EB484FE|nr:hypothetical protein [Flavisolibacter nicotianae]
MIRKTANLLFAVFGSVLLLSSCKNYYMARRVQPGQDANGEIDSLYNQARFFVLRTGSQAFYMKTMSLSSDQKTLTTTLDTLPPEHRLHLVNGRGGEMRYKKDDFADAGVLNEVHLYVPSMDVRAGETVNLSLDKVQKIEVLEKDKKRTTNSYVLGAIGFTLGTLAVAGVIIAATKSSCPFVSAYNGQEFLLQGEIYGGALYPQLARHDYLPLRMQPLADGTLQLKISNELKEKQYTDLSSLLVIKHDPGVKILPDENGKLYSVRSAAAPVSAKLGSGKDLLPFLLKENDQAVAYLDDQTTVDGSNTVSLQFTKAKKAKLAKLVLSLKNSYWLDQLYGELAQGFGRYYATYLDKQSKKPASQLVRWTKEQQIPLTVSLSAAGGWKKVADLTTTGPLANRSVVVPVDLSGVEGDIVNIRLSTGFLFWELDYAGIDFSANEAFGVEELSPAEARDERGQDVLAPLQREDNHFLEQPQIGNVATLVYKPSPRDESKSYTYILHAKGWYRHVRDFTGKPNIAFLKQFTRPNAFPLYGRTRFRQIESQTLRMMAANN